MHKRIFKFINNWAAIIIRKEKKSQTTLKGSRSLGIRQAEAPCGVKVKIKTEAPHSPFAEPWFFHKTNDIL